MQETDTAHLDRMAIKEWFSLSVFKTGAWAKGGELGDEYIYEVILFFLGCQEQAIFGQNARSAGSLGFAPIPEVEQKTLNPNVSLPALRTGSYTRGPQESWAFQVQVAKCTGCRDDR